MFCIWEPNCVMTGDGLPSITTNHPPLFWWKNKFWRNPYYMDHVSSEIFFWPHTIRYERELRYEIVFLNKWLNWASLVDCLHYDIIELCSFAMINLWYCFPLFWPMIVFFGPIGCAGLGWSGGWFQQKLVPGPRPKAPIGSSLPPSLQPARHD